MSKNVWAITSLEPVRDELGERAWVNFSWSNDDFFVSRVEIRFALTDPGILAASIPDIEALGKDKLLKLLQAGMASIP